MGVHGLWELLAPVGRRVSVETLAGKKLAIDASIWLVQFMKAMRDDKGEMVRNAHLIGFFRRICKLLFLRTKPVFVFDGGTPALKRRTVIARRRQRENAQAKIRKTAEKLLLNHLKSLRLKELANDLKNQGGMNDVKGKKVLSDHPDGFDENGDEILRKHNQEKLDEMLAASIAAEEDGRFTNAASASNAIPSDEDDENEEMFFPGNVEEVDHALQNALPPDLLVQMGRRPSTRDGGYLGQPEKGKKILPYQMESGKINSEKTEAMSKCHAQEELDAMLAASIAAEEDGRVFNNAAASSTAVHSDEDDSDGYEEIMPEMQGPVDHAVLDSLPLSMRLDLFAQMKERQMAENRQKYQRVKKAPEKFSELQIQSYLKAVALRREINQVQKAASGSGVDGVQTSRIASEANKKFIFSSSFTGSKEKLVPARTESDKGGQNSTVIDHLSSDSSHGGFPSTSKFSGLVETTSNTNLKDGVETFLDERGHIRVSRVRAMGIRMTRDLQRNLDLMRETEKDKTSASSYLANIESQFRNGDPSREKEILSENLDSANDETVQLDDRNELHVDENEASIQISFEDDGETRCLDGDEEIFARLVAEASIKVPSPEKNASLIQASDSASDCDWEEGIVDSCSDYRKVETKSSLEEGCNGDSEVEWEDGISDIPKSTSCSAELGKSISKGSLEEDADLREAIKRSLEEQKYNVALGKKRPLEKSSNQYTFLSDSANSTVGRSIFYDNMTEPACEVSDCAATVNCQDGTGISLMAYSSEKQESISIQLSMAAGKSCQTVESSCFELAKQDHSEIGNLHKSEPLPEFSRHLGADVRYITEEGQLNVSAEICGLSASAVAPSRERLCFSDGVLMDTSGSVSHAGESKKTQAIASNVAIEETNLSTRQFESPKTVSPNKFLLEQIAPDNHGDDFTEKLQVEKIPIEASGDIEVIKSNLEEEMRKLDQENRTLGDEQKKHERNAESVSSEMFTECQELLQMFGLPYIIAPMEAEAQCAHLEVANLVDGVVTDDSDVFLFGAQSVYKNIFDDRKYVETYFMKDIEKELGLTREKLIRMALLLGSDYTEGISGIGIVNAIEVVNAFPEKDGLHKFREWIESPDPSILGKADKNTGYKKGLKVCRINNNCPKVDVIDAPTGDQNDSQSNDLQQPDGHVEELKQHFMDTHRNVSKNWHIPPNFPSEAVTSAYLAPQVDKSAEPFSWGKPDIFLLRKLCWEKFSWNGQKADELLLPVLNEYNKHETQLRLEAFYTFNEKFAKIRSKRIKKAVKGITGNRSSELMDDALKAASRNGRKRRAGAGELGENIEKNSSGKDEILDQNLSVSTGKFRNRKRKVNGETILSGVNNSEPSKLAKSNTSTKRVGNSRTGRGRGGRRTRRGGKDTPDSGIAEESGSFDCSSDDDDLQLPVEKFEGPQEVRRSTRSRKAVRYTVENSEDDDTNKSPVLGHDKHQDKATNDLLAQNMGSDAASGLYRKNPLATGESAPVDGFPEDSLAGGFCSDEGDIDLPEKGNDGGPPEDDYLKMGGGFCMEDADEGSDPDGAYDHAEEPPTEEYNNTIPSHDSVLADKCDRGNSSVPSVSTRDKVSDEVHEERTSKATDAKHNHHDHENSTSNNGSNARIGHAGALSAMPFLRRKRKKT